MTNTELLTKILKELEAIHKQIRISDWDGIELFIVITISILILLLKPVREAE